MDIRGVDLNLLPVLDALLRQRSATLAARELQMSQSALSAALARLRTLLGDELFVRTGRGLRPTARAAELQQPVAEILERVRDGVLQRSAFSPAAAAQAARAFRLSHSDVGAYVLWPRIVQAVRRAAPGVRLQLRVLGEGDIAPALADGLVDLAIGSYPRLPGSLFQQRLFDRRYVGLLRRGHPLAGRVPTLRQFALAPHIVVRQASGVQDRIDEALARHGLQRADCTELPSYLMLPPLLQAGDFVAVLPGQLAEAFCQQHACVAVALPLALPAATVRMHWHRRFHQDAGNQWLREQVVAALADVDGEAGLAAAAAGPRGG